MGNVLLVEIDADTTRQVRGLLSDPDDRHPVDVVALSADALMSAVTSDPGRVDGVLLGPHLADPIRVVQRLHGLDHDLAVVVLAEAARWPSISRALRFAPFVGDQASSHPLGDEHIADDLRARVARTRDRRAHRAVVAAVQRRAAPPAPGARARDARLLNQLLDHAPVGIVAVDGRGVVLGWNRCAGAILGRSETESLGIGLGSVFSDEAAAGLQSCLDEVAAGGSVRARRLHRTMPDGRVQHLDVSAAAIDPGPEERSAVVMIEDVTERELLEERLRQSQKMEAVGRLAGGIAHDFNNLLTAILGYSELLEHLLPADQPGREEATEIHRAAWRAAELTRQLLAFSRSQVLQPRVMDLNEAVLALESLLRRVLGEGIRLELATAPDLWPILADPGQIEQVIINLATNARDAMPDGGTLTIATSNVTRVGGAAGSGGAAGEFVLLSVSDTGHGIDKATIARVFEPFFTTKELGRGTGLGLSTVHGIVSQTGGDIVVESELGNGTTFRVSLPRSRDSLPQPNDAVTHADAPRGAETVLLVEDDAVVRRLVRGTLEGFGYTVLEAESGAAALAAASTHPGPIAAVVSDLVLPGMGGRELVEELVRLRPRLGVLFMSGYTDDPIVRLGGFAPGADYLQKPFTPSALALKLRAVIDARY
jgi:two-component system, cell cycle sensor histidine kinase and response regulator CckA